MLFTPQSSQEYPIKLRINNISNMLTKIKLQYQPDDKNNAYIDAYLNSIEYILIRLIKKINETKNNNDNTPFNLE